MSFPDANSSKKANIPSISITTSTTNLNAEAGQYAIEQGDVGDFTLTTPHSPRVSISSVDSPITQSPNSYNRTLTESPSDRNLLSPKSLAPILREPSSPAPSYPSNSDQGSISTAPPSPTLSSRSSVHFQQPTTLNLRENHPGSGLSSLHMLSPETAYRHRRKNSNASHTASSVDETVEGTELESFRPYTPVASGSRSDGGSMATAPSPTITAIDGMSEISHDNGHKGKENVHDGHEDVSRSGEDVAVQGMEGKSKFDETAVLPEEDINPAPFVFKPSQLASLVDPKNLTLLTELGGVEELIKGLGTHPLHGLSKRALGENTDSEVKHVNEESTIYGQFAASADDRRRVYGPNVIPARRSKSLALLMWLAFKDKVLVLLSISAVISLALGLFQDFGPSRVTVPCEDNPEKQCQSARVDWVEGVAIMVAILIVVVVGSLNDWQKERQFQALNEKKEDRGVKVIRYGVEMIINVKEVLVGDIVLLEPGEVIPCDGVYLRGHNVRCDESGATGESDAIRKAPYQACLEAKERGETLKKDCFIISGSKVLEGVGAYVVIAVGERSFNGRIMMALRGDSENTPLQLKLNALAELIAKLGTAAGLILFVALMIKFFVQLKTEPDRSPSVKAMSFVQILIISVTVIVVAVPEGLPLAVTLALAFATKRMTKENLLVRVLGSCEIMANASVICTDKTGTLTQNVMSVVAGSIGIHCKFVHRLEENKSRTNMHDQDESHRIHGKDFAIDQKELNSALHPPLRVLFNEAIAINSTAFEDVDPKTGKPVFVGSKTETSLLAFAQGLEWNNYKETRDGAEVVQMFPFSSERKAMGVVIRTTNGKWRIYLKGASEILTKLCTRHVLVPSPNERPDSDGTEIETRIIDDRARDNTSRSIIFYANQMLRTLALCYREFDSWPPKGYTDEDVPWSALVCDLTLIAIIGIEDPLRDGVRDAVAKCHKAGVSVKMVTGDNVLTARSIASRCGIFTAGGIITEGPIFRGLSLEDRLQIVPRLQVLARSSPEDKKLLVDTLRSLGEIVSVTGDGTNDGPALKTAHVGFSMGIAGTEVAKEASDIILMDDNFASIVSAIMWGRCVNDAVRKFLQFQVTVNIAAVIITIVSALASNSEVPVLTAVQLLWINIIMDTFAALALATDPASPAHLDRKPDPKAQLFSVAMGKQILGQALYQVIIILVFHFLGDHIFGYTHPANRAIENKNNMILNTLVFNIFVFTQIFNSVNCRSITNDKNVFRGVLNNWYFMGITLIEIGVQILIVFVGGAAFQVTSIGIREWGISLALGVMSIPIGFLLRLIPDPPVQRAFIKLRLMRNPDAPLPTVSPDRGEWNTAINLVRDNLMTFSNIRGGRLRASSFVGKSRSARLQEAGVRLPSLMTMVPTLVASSVGAGWSPHPGSLSDPSNTDPSRSSAALWEGKLQFHPDTRHDDEAYRKWGQPSA